MNRGRKVNVCKREKSTMILNEFFYIYPVPVIAMAAATSSTD